MIIGKKTIYIIAYFIFALFCFSLYKRLPHIDDAWLGEQVYWLNKDGIVKNVLMKYFLNSHNELIAYHKLTIWFGVFFVKIFGFSLLTLKSISLISLLIFLSAYYYYCVTLNKLVSKQNFILVAGLILIAPHVFEFSFVYRPELPMMATSFISFIFLDISRNNKRETLYIIGSAFFTGLSVLIHLNGLIFISASVVFLIYRKQYKSIIYFIIITLGISAYYFSHFDSIQEFNSWREIISSTEADSLKSNEFTKVLFGMLSSVFNEHLRLFHSPKEIVLTLFTVLIIVLGFSQFKKQKPGLLLYFFILFLSIAIISINKSSKYSVVYYPYIVLLIIYYVKKNFTIKGNKFIISKNSRSYLFIFFLSLFIATSLFYDILISSKKYYPSHNRNITMKYIESPSQNKTILAPMIFIFDEIDNYNEIIGLMSINERKKTEPNLKGNDFFITANNEGIDYILLTDYYWKSLDLPDTLVTQISHFNIIGREYELIILQNNMISNSNIGE